MATSEWFVLSVDLPGNEIWVKSLEADSAEAAKAALRPEIPGHALLAAFEVGSHDWGERLVRWVRTCGLPKAVVQKFLDDLLARLKPGSTLPLKATVHIEDR